MEGGGIRVSRSIDEKVVKATFDNAQFERGVNTTLQSLERLNKGLKLEGASKGLSDISSAASKFSLGHIGQGIDQLVSKFGALSVVGITALTNIANRAVDAGLRLVKSFSVSPIIDGLHEYETNLNSIQTILSNTGLEGQAGLNKVNGALQALNTYSDKTIYNFSEMARNIGTFTAAGVDLDTSVKAIKGIANLAAISGSSAEQASTAMYQLSQALATGKVKLQDWNSVVNAGLGGKVFQNAIIETAKVHGIAIDDIIKKNGSFRDSLQEGWLTSQILTESLEKFTGDLNASQLKTLGYTDTQIKGILKLGKNASDAATKIKTFTQLINTLQEAAGSGWSQTWQIIFGDFDEAKSLFTNVNNVLSGFINASSKARNKVLQDWKDLGGRTAIINAIANTFTALINVLRPIRDAFREIFPATTGKQLADFSKALEAFTKKLIIGSETADKLKRSFAGVFAVFDILATVVKTALKAFFSLFDGAGQGASSFLDLTANIGDFLVKLDKAIKSGTGLTTFFQTIANVIKVPIRLIGQFASLIVQIFEGAANIDTSSLDKFTARFSALGVIGKLVAQIWTRVLGALSAVYKAFEPLAQKFSDFFSQLGDTISQALDGVDYNNVLDSINTGLLAGITLLIRKFFKGGLSVDVGGGFLGTIKEAFEGLTGTLQAMQTQLKAQALIRIAGAVALLVASIVALSLIDSKKLTVALGGLAAVFTELLIATAVLEKVTTSKGFLKVPAATLSLIGLAIAVDLLTIAVAKLSKLDLVSLIKGLAGTITLILALSGAAKIISGNSKGLITAGAGLILLAVAVDVLVTAVKKLGDLDVASLAKGLVSVAVLLGSLALFTKFAAADKGGVLQGAGLLLLAAGIKILASAVADFAKISWEGIAKGLVGIAGGLILMGTAITLIPPTSVLSAAAVLIVASSLSLIGDAVNKMGTVPWEVIGKGLVSLAGALTLISVALALLPPSSLLSAAAIFVVASSLGMIADALGKMGAQTWESIAKGLITLAGSLTIIAAALYLMTGALPGAAAVLVVAAALRVLTPVLEALGKMSWGEIAKGLATLAGVFLVLGLAGLALAPVTPILLALGVAITLLGIGALAAGAGVLAFSAGLAALAVSGAAGAAAIVGIVKSLVGLIPIVMKQIGLGIVAFANVIATAGPAMLKAMTTVILAIVGAITRTAPQVLAALARMLVQFLGIMNQYVPSIIAAGARLIISILSGIAANISKIVTAATSVVVNFINGVSKNLPRVIDAGVKLIISFVNGLANAIRSNQGAMNAAGRNLASAIISGMASGLASGVGVIADKARSVASSALNAAKNFLGINSPSKEFIKIGMGVNEGFAKGLDKYTHLTENATEGVGKASILAMQKSLSGMQDIMGGEVDLNPVVRPVLDLSDIKKNADKLTEMIPRQTVNVTTSTDTATNIANRRPPGDQPPPDGGGMTTGGSWQFVQNNYSPKALSSAEIYRQTKNQLSIVKKGVGSA